MPNDFTPEQIAELVICVKQRHKLWHGVKRKDPDELICQLQAENDALNVYVPYCLAIIEQLQRQLAEARNRPAEGWMKQAAESFASFLLKTVETEDYPVRWDAYCETVAEHIARHAPDLAEVRKAALLEAAEHFESGQQPHQPGSWIGRELREMANASSAEPPKEN